MIRKAYVEVAHGHVHYRIAGSGPAIVLLHDSPRSSGMHGPLLEALSARATVIALDTPGYGHSTPLPPQPVRDIPAFAESLAQTLRAIGIGPCPVYGFHTSSKILLELAIRHAELVSLAMFDGISLPAGGANEDFIARYMAPYEERDDGSHLATTWSRARDLHRFFPWFARSAGARLPIDMPDDRALHAYVLDLLMAGPHYSDAYSAAMRYEALPRLASLDVPAHFLCRANDPLYGYLDVVERHLPRRATLERLGADPEAWLARVTALLAKAARDGHEPSPPASRSVSPPVSPRAFSCGYGDSHDGQLHFRHYAPRGDVRRTLLLLPELPGSASGVDAPAAAMAAQGCEVYAVDLPGIGESSALTARRHEAEAHATVLKRWIAQLGVEAIDVMAEFTAVPIAWALARLDPRVRSVVADGSPPLGEAERTRLLEDYWPPLSPRRDGTHLIALWHRLRDRELAWPWHDGRAAVMRKHNADLDPARLTALVVDLAQQLEHHADACIAALSYDSRAALHALRQPVFLLDDADDPRYEHVGAVAQIPRYASRMTRARDVETRTRDIVRALAAPR